MVIRISDKTQNYSKVTKLLVKPKINSITKSNIIILNDQEVHLNKIILIGRSDYTNKRL